MNCRRCKKKMAYVDESSTTTTDICTGCALEIGVYSVEELTAIMRHLDDGSSWETINEFWQVWSPRLNDALRKLILTALANKAARDLQIETFKIPDRGDGPANLVRTFTEGDTLIQEFEIESGPRKGTILTLRTKVSP